MPEPRESNPFHPGSGETYSPLHKDPNLSDSEKFEEREDRILKNEPIERGKGSRRKKGPEIPEVIEKQGS